jgi:cytochrome c biogenesis protein CcmG, thiol:disulfide interchange protein DsbE
VPEETNPERKRRLMVFAPFVLFLGLVGIFGFQLMSGKNVSDLPSALIGKVAPATNLSSVDPVAQTGLNSEVFKGRVTLVNVFASWCVPCREEHPVLLELAKDKRFIIAGLNYKDQPENALRFLAELGNPYAVTGSDLSGRTGIEWGVYGVPETYLVGKAGTVLYKHIGPLDAHILANELMPEIEKALSGS